MNEKDETEKKIDRVCDSLDGAIDGFRQTTEAVLVMRSSLLEERKIEVDTLRLAVNTSIAQDERHRQDMALMMSELSKTGKSVAETNKTVSVMAAEFHGALDEVRVMTKCVGETVNEIKSDKKEIFIRINDLDKNVATINATIGANKELAAVKINNVKNTDELRDKKELDSRQILIGVMGVALTAIGVILALNGVKV